MSMSNTEKTVKEIRRNTRRKFSTEEKMRYSPRWLTRRELGCRAVPSGRHQSQSLLLLEQRFP